MEHQKKNPNRQWPKLCNHNKRRNHHHRPWEKKEHIAEYFENLYQARPGTPEYENWTKYIETLQSAEPATEEPE